MQTSGCLRIRAGGKIRIMNYKGSMKLGGGEAMKMFVNLIVNMILQMYSFVKTHLILYLKHVQFMIYQLNLTKM